MIRTGCRVLSILALTALAVPASAAEPSPVDRGAAARRALRTPGPLDATSFRGDVTIEGLWAGTASFEVRAGTFVRKPVWKVTEKRYIDFQGVEQQIALSYMLGADLALRSGRAEATVQGRQVVTVFGPVTTGIQVIRTVTASDGKESSESLTLKAPSSAMSGLPSLVLLARALPERLADEHAVPWFPLTEVCLGGTPTETGERHVTLAAVSPRGESGAWGMRITDGASASVLRLSSDRRQLLRLEGPRFHIVPEGEGGERVALREEAPATTWQEAFLKFGYGYHMARRPLLEAAFHWPSMYEHETTVTKSWRGNDDLAAFREAWLAEFLRQSLRRTRAATERLLNMTLASGKVTAKGDAEIVFAAHANFGGGTQRTYTLRKVEGTWYIASVKF